MPKNCTLLLVEDDENDAFFIKRALKKLGFTGTLLHFTATEDAKFHLRASKPGEKRPLPHLIIADSAVSIRDSGVEFLEWVRRESVIPKVPFIILSGGVSAETQQRAEAAGIRKILNKGAGHSEMLARLRSVLEELPPECREWLTPLPESFSPNPSAP